MRRVRQPACHHPGSRALHIEEGNQLLPPALARLPQSIEPLTALVRVARHELDAALAVRKGRRSHIDTEHRPKPRIFADALMHHVFVKAPPTAVVMPWTNSEILVAEFTPDAQDLQSLAVVAVDQEVVNHNR